MCIYIMLKVINSKHNLMRSIHFINDWNLDISLKMLHDPGASCILHVHMKHYSSLDALLYYKQRRPTTTSYKYNAHYLPFPFTIFFRRCNIIFTFRVANHLWYDNFFFHGPFRKKNTQDRASSVIILTESNIPQIFSTFLILVVL